MGGEREKEREVRIIEWRRKGRRHWQNGIFQIEESGSIKLCNMDIGYAYGIYTLVVYSEKVLSIWYKWHIACGSCCSNEIVQKFIYLHLYKAKDTYDIHIGHRPICTKRVQIESWISKHEIYAVRYSKQTMNKKTVSFFFYHIFKHILCVGLPLQKPRREKKQQHHTMSSESSWYKIWTYMVYTLSLSVRSMILVGYRVHWLASLYM